VSRGSRGKAVRMRLLGALATASGLALSLGIGTATAHKFAYESNVQVKADAVSDTVLGLSGKVTSDRAKCVSGRTITITANGVEIATATTLANGEWSAQATPRPPKGTTLIATTPRKFLKRSNRHRHKCESDFSERRAP